MTVATAIRVALEEAAARTASVTLTEIEAAELHNAAAAWQRHLAELHRSGEPTTARRDALACAVDRLRDAGLIP